LHVMPMNNITSWWPLRKNMRHLQYYWAQQSNTCCFFGNLKRQQVRFLYVYFFFI